MMTKLLKKFISNRLFKKAQMLGARGGAIEAYLSGTSKESQRGERRK